MISPFVKFYVYVETKKKKQKHKDIDEILNKEINRFNNWNGNIRYAWFWSAGVHVPNASATIPGIILINAEWATKIVLDQDNPYMHDAFALTVCHEMTHQDRDFYYFDFFTSDGKFVNWVDEVHADFGGIQKGLNGDRTRAAFAMKYKMSCKHNKDKDRRSHPSWKRRIEYITNHDFNDKLIDQIAIDCGCSNSKLISAVKGYFEMIELRGVKAMKFGVRTPSIKKSLKARTTGKVKRKVKKALIPGYGKKGMGWIKNPKKAAYNKVYNKASFSLFDLFK